jgi:hypothetical protein
METESHGSSDNPGAAPEVRGYEQALTDLKTAFDQLRNFAFEKPAGVWGRYGVAGGSLVSGGSVAIVALTAPMITLSGWTAEDLIACMSSAVLLIVIGTATQLVNANMKDRRFEAQVGLYGKYEQAVREVGRDILAALEPGKPEAPIESPPSVAPGARLRRPA